jgi:hypothetical protein
MVRRTEGEGDRVGTVGCRCVLAERADPVTLTLTLTLTLDASRLDLSRSRGRG